MDETATAPVATAEPVVTTTPGAMDPVEQQAIRMAEAIAPQLDAAIQRRMDEAVDRMSTESLRAMGVAFERVAAVSRPPVPPTTAGQPPRPYATFGEQLVAIAQGSRRGVAADAGLLEIMAANGMSEGVAADGGFLLQDTFADGIFRHDHATGDVFGRIPANRRFQLTGNSNSIKMPAIDETSRADGSRWGGVQAYWVPEGGSVTATKPTLARVGLELNKLMATSYLTNEQMTDTPILEGLVREGFAEEFGFKLDDGCINGTGVGEPLGILNAAATVSVAKETGQAAATLVFENIVKMWSRMTARSRQNAVWFVNQDIEPQLFALSLAVGTGGIPVYLPANGLSQSPFGTLFGRPVVPIEQCATLGTVGDIILADVSQYWAIERGTNFASSIHVAFLSDEIAFRATYRADYRPMWTSALTPYKGTSNTVSPFVTLATRA